MWLWFDRCPAWFLSGGHALCEGVVKSDVFVLVVVAAAAVAAAVVVVVVCSG